MATPVERDREAGDASGVVGGVGPGAAVEDVVARGADQAVVARVAVQGVVARAAVEAVGAGAAVERVDAVPADEDVVALGTDQRRRYGHGRDHDVVVAVAAVEVQRGDPGGVAAHRVRASIGVHGAGVHGRARVGHGEGARREHDRDVVGLPVRGDEGQRRAGYRDGGRVGSRRSRERNQHAAEQEYAA